MSTLLSFVLSFTFFERGGVVVFAAPLTGISHHQSSLSWCTNGEYRGLSSALKVPVLTPRRRTPRAAGMHPAQQTYH